MSLPALLDQRLRLPVVAAPMFLVSFPPLVKALCQAGVVGTFPHVNARPTAQLDAWLTEIAADLAAYRAAQPQAVVAPHGVNPSPQETHVPPVQTPPGQAFEQEPQYPGSVWKSLQMP